MRPFAYARADDAATAMRLARSDGAATPPTSAATQFIAGGTLLLDLMKLDTMRPATLVDINGLKDRYGRVELRGDGLHLGALTRMASAAADPSILRDFPVIAQSLQLAASAQIRNMASLGGNVLQRTRCSYFRESDWSACNKRKPGSGCAALGGNNRKHAVLGVNDACIASYPGDFAQALVALGATTETAGPNGPRSFAFEQLHAGPDRPDVETILQPGELITGFLIPTGRWTRRSLYLKVRDRQSYEFGLATAAVALDLDGDQVNEIRIGLGGVAYRPWRAHAAEALLRGRTLTEATATEAAGAAFADAKPRNDNRYKIELGQRTLVRALLQAKSMEVRS